MKKGKANKANKLIFLSVVIVLVVVAFIIFILNFSKDSSSLSLIEKNWINNNTNSIIDVNVYNDVPIFGQNGKGIIFEFLDDFSKEYKIEFNKISYLANTGDNAKEKIAFKILENNKELSKEDILLYQDHYVLVSKKDLVNSGDIKDTKIGLLNNDLAIVNNYLGDFDNISYTPYDDLDKTFEALNKDEVEYVAVPMMMSLDHIFEGNYNIVYHISDVVKKYVLEINDNKTLLNIMKKYNIIYQEERYQEDYKDNFLSTFFTAKKISELEQTNYNTSSYTYGYVINMPFENTISKEFVGIISNYLSGIEEIANVDFKIVSYENIDKLKEALSKGEVDIAFAYFDPKNLNIDIINTTSLFDEKIAIISRNNTIVNSVKSLQDKEVLTVAGTYISDYLFSNGIKIKTYNNTDDLLRNVKNDSIIAIDYNTYIYYLHKKFDKYKLLYTDNLNNNYRFIIRDVNKNITFGEILKGYVSTVNFKDIQYNYNTDYMVSNNNILLILLKIIIAMIVILIIIRTTLKTVSKKKNNKNKLSKEEKYKFIDVMTSLKNRNYLNYNIKSWDENVIYPQTILIIDLNNIKYINDSHGHDEGDSVIKKAANILIIHQVENTDIVRTDGNEFLIYMVGYKEDYVIDYIRKLNRAFKELPYGFGATIGYSMITDDIKTIDDAINEATIAMRQAKEKK